LLLIDQEQELCVCELTTALNISQPKVSRHLAQLRKCGLLQDRKYGQWVFYSINPGIKQWVKTIISDTRNFNEDYYKENITNLNKMENRPLCCDNKSRVTAMKILFICTHNRCRSILGEAITRHETTGQIEVASAGSSPADAIHPLTIKELQKRNINVSNLKSKSWDELEDFEPDVVITVCDNAANEQCPIWFGKAVKAHWGLPDPTSLNGSEKEVELLFDKVIKTIENRIKSLETHDLKSLPTEELVKLLNKVGEIN
jgi:arsenate reductase